MRVPAERIELLRDHLRRPDRQAGRREEVLSCLPARAGRCLSGKWRAIRLAGFPLPLALTDATSLLEPRRIQGFKETVLSAIFDSLTHLSGHAQEIVSLTRMQLGDSYRFAWVPLTPEQGAPPGEVPGAETVAVRDAVF